LGPFGFFDGPEFSWLIKRPSKELVMRAILLVLLDGLSFAMSAAADISVFVHLPSVESTNAVLRRDGGAGKDTRLKAIRNSPGDEKTGFVVE
jgi:hypothetical protein